MDGTGNVMTVFRKVAVITGYLLAVSVIGVATLASICSLFSPWLHEHREYFAKIAGDVLGKEVTLRDVRLTWDVTEPVLYLSDVKLADPHSKKTIIAFDRIKVRLAVWDSLMHWQWRPEGLVLVGSEITLPPWTAGTSRSLLVGPIAVFTAVLRESDLLLKKIIVNVTLPHGEVRRILLKQLYVKSGGGKHKAKADLMLLQELPTRAQWTAEWEDRPGAPSLIPLRAKTAVVLTDLSLSQFFSDTSWQSLRIPSGLGDVTLQGEWADGWQSIEGSGEFTHLILRSLQTKQERTFSAVSGTVGWRKKDGVHQIAGAHLLLDMGDHVWPETHFSLVLDPQRDNVRLDTGYLNLTDTADCLTALGLVPDPAKQWVQSIQVAGVVDDMHLSAGSDVLSKGTLSLTTRDIRATMDKVFEKPLLLRHLTGTVAWGNHQDSGVSWVTVSPLKIDNADGEVDATLNWTIPKKGQPQLRLTSHFSIRHGENMTRYLPLRQMNPQLVKWLKAAFLRGSVTEGQAVFFGKPADFPFDHHDGVFTISAVVHDTGLHFAPGWPDLQNISGKLFFSGRKMAAHIQSADISQMKLSSVNAVIPQMGKGVPVLSVTGLAAGDLAEGAEFIRTSPLNNAVGKYLQGQDLSGPVQLRLTMDLPLENTDAVTLRGDMNIPEAGSLRLNSWKIQADALHGKIAFTEKGIVTGILAGKMFAEPVQILFHRAKKAGSPLTAVVQGRVSVKAGEKILPVKLAAGVLTGATNYQADLSFSKGGAAPDIVLRSTLLGLGVNLYGWYQKSPRQAVDFKLSFHSGAARKIDFRYAAFSGSVSLPDGSPAEIYLPKLVLGPLKKGMHGLTNPADWPAVNFRSDDISYGSIHFGRVGFQLQPLKNGLKIAQLTVRSPLFTVNATGEWLKLGSRLTGALKADRTDRLLAAFGQGSRSFEAGPGRIQFDLSWPGSPFAVSLKALSGNVSIDIGKGLITHLDAETSQKMGLGRMLSLFSLQSLPRRFSLDFSDLFQKGYGFDSMRGDFVLGNGSAITDNAVVKGVVAQVNVRGRFGLAAQDYDLHMEILPQITSSLPVVTAIATANPLVGVAAWMLDKAVSPAVSKMTTYRYRITGSWSHPVWEKVGESA